MRAIHFWKPSIFLFLFTYTSVQSQGVVTVNYKTQRYIDDVSTFDRAKYFNVHGMLKQSDKDVTQFISNYNISKNYIGSRGFGSALGKIKNGKIPKIKKLFSGNRNVYNYVHTGRSKSIFYKKDVDYSTIDVSNFSKKAVQFSADYYSYQQEIVPKYLEPFNEPMVHALDLYPEGKNKRKYILDKIDTIVVKICEFHRELGKKIHATPQLKNMKVMGYASAYPEFEAKDFRVWNSKYKKFIDIAGKDMDVFSVHLYDGSGHVNNKGGRRSGSNAEAILDLIEAYSFEKLNTVKPIAITEYGRLVQDQPDYQNTTNYEPIENSQAVRSQNHMVMNFMERANKMELSIPFTVGKPKNPSYKYSKASLWTAISGKWELTPRKYFFEIWKGVKGERVRFNSTNIDVQTQAFVDNKQLYVVLNNLNDKPQNVNLNIADTKGLKKVVVKRLKVFNNKTPELTETPQESAPNNILLQYGETAVITYYFKQKISFNNTIHSKKYYAKGCVKAIKANDLNTYTINNINTGKGDAILRLGVGRNHGLSLTPNIEINGKAIALKSDIIRGYNQHNRKRFFGTLEIPISMDILKNNNEITVKFPDKGGHISSVILQVNTLKK